MNSVYSKLKLFLSACLVAASFSLAAQTVKITLSGMQEVPAVTTSASGTGTVTIAADQTVSGSVTTNGVDGTMAHIHLAPSGQNGPVIVPMTKTAENTWSIPSGAKLSDAQFQSFKEGNLYINVHSASNKGGEIRGQLKP